MLSGKISIQFLFVYTFTVFLCSIKGDSSNYNYNHPPFSAIEAIPVAIVYDDQLASSGRSAATTESLLTTYHPRFRKIKALEEATEAINTMEIKENILQKSNTVLQTLNSRNNLQIPVAVVYDKIDDIKKSTKENLEKLTNHMHLKPQTFRGNIKASLTKEPKTLTNDKRVSIVNKSDKLIIESNTEPNTLGENSASIDFTQNINTKPSEDTPKQSVSSNRGNIRASPTKETSTVLPSKAESTVIEYDKSSAGVNTDSNTTNSIILTENTKTSPFQLKSLITTTEKVGSIKVSSSKIESTVHKNDKVTMKINTKSNTTGAYYISIDGTENINASINYETLKPTTEKVTTISRRNVLRSRKTTTAPPAIVSKTSEIANPENSSKNIPNNNIQQVTRIASKSESSQTIKKNENENKKSLEINTNTQANKENMFSSSLDQLSSNVQKQLNKDDNTKTAPQAQIYENKDKLKRTRTKDPVVPIIDSQNYVFSHSGDFHYSYESGDGTKAFEEGSMKPNESVIGGFSYKDNEGNDISLTYKAGVDGYQPVGSHLPTPPPIPPAIARALKYLATKTTPADEAVTESLKQ